MSDARDDVYRLAALLADLDRVLNPLPRSGGGGCRVEPPIPPPLPTSGGAAGPRGLEGAHGATARGAPRVDASGEAIARRASDATRRREGAPAHAPAAREPAAERA